MPWHCLVCQLPQLTYIFRRLGNFLKMPVASRTDISLSFSRLHGKQADEVAAELRVGHPPPCLPCPPGPPRLQLSCAWASHSARIKRTRDNSASALQHGRGGRGKQEEALASHLPSFCRVPVTTSRPQEASPRSNLSAPSRPRPSAGGCAGTPGPAFRPAQGGQEDSEAVPCPVPRGLVTAKRRVVITRKTTSVHVGFLCTGFKVNLCLPSLTHLPSPSWRWDHCLHRYTEGSADTQI